MADGRWGMYDLGNLGLWVMVDDGMADGGWRMADGGWVMGGCILRERVQVKLLGDAF
jgi:hypothetical protein